MAINDSDELHRRSLLYEYEEEDEGKSRTTTDWTSPILEESENESNPDLNSYDHKLSSYGDEPSANGSVRILYPPPPQSKSFPKYPKEIRKTVLAFGMVLLSLVMNSVSIALTHDRVPDGPPLPDVIQIIPPFPRLMTVPDVLAMITIFLCLSNILLHRHRWIVARRVLFILSLLYAMRSVTMYSTVLPVANTTVYCSPKSNSTSILTVLRRVGELLGGGGMQISGQKKSCGDYIYSGHTALLVTGYLILKEYSPRKFVILHWISWGMSWAGMIILLLARGHYTIDVIIGYFVATRLFWTYHSLCNNSQLKTRTENNYHSNVWWYPVFQYFEGNVMGRVPNQYSLPWSLQRNRFRHSIFR